jgi:hypothetical protein
VSHPNNLDLVFTGEEYQLVKDEIDKIYGTHQLPKFLITFIFYLFFLCNGCWFLSSGADFYENEQKELAVKAIPENSQSEEEEEIEEEDFIV